MIQRLETLTNYSLLNDFVSSPPSALAFYGCKYNISFAILLFLYLAIQRRPSWLSIGLIALIAIPFSLTDQLLFETFTPTANNPQVPHYVMLLASFSIVLIQSLLWPFRTQGRIFGAIIGLGCIGAFLLIHAATVNIKLREQVLNQEISHLAVINTSLARDDAGFFSDYCKFSDVMCLTAKPTPKQEEALRLKLHTNYDEAFETIRNGGEHHYSSAVSLDTQHGAYLFMYATSDGKTRIVLDEKNTNKFHHSALKVTYGWYFVVSSLWLYGGLFIMWKHRLFTVRTAAYILAAKRRPR